MEADRHFGVARTGFLGDSDVMADLKRTASHRRAMGGSTGKKFFSAAASGASGVKKASRKASKRAARNCVPEDQVRLFAEVMRATARSLAT
jgi:hypothetical protein